MNLPHSSLKFNSLQQFHITKSRRLCWMLMLIHGLAGVASWLNALPMLFKLLILLLIIISLSRYLQHFWYQFQPYTLSYTAASGWKIGLKNNSLDMIQLLATSVMTTQLIVLHFRLQNGKKHRLLIMNDVLSDKDYRALLVMLKITGLAKKQQVR